MRFSLPGLLMLAMLLSVGLTEKAHGEFRHLRVGSGPSPARFEVIKDFTTDFESGQVTESSSYSASQREISGKVPLPGIFLHPIAMDDAILAFKEVALPVSAEEEPLFLVFRVGFRDDIPWGTGDVIPNGCRFSIHVDGKQVFSEAFAGTGWQARAIRLEPAKARNTTFEFHVNAIDGRPNYDWALFGAPMIIKMPKTKLGSIVLAAGVVLAEVRASKQTKATISMEGVSEQLVVGPDPIWVPLFFKEKNTPPTITSEDGTASIGIILVANAPFKEVWKESALSSPLLTANTPFSYWATLKNEGDGDIYAGMGESLSVSGLDLGPVTKTPRSCGGLKHGKSFSYRWDGLIAKTSGDAVLNTPMGNLPIHMFGPEPITSTDHVTTSEVRVTPNAPITATVSTANARLSFIVEKSEDAYAIAETWDGQKWQRTGSLYPLASLYGATDQGVIGAPGEPLAFKVENIQSDQNTLHITGNVQDIPVELEFKVDSAKPHIAMTASLHPKQDLQLYAFYGPTVLAGDRAYGVKKDFALFPGLEYLEGDEPSSSERDLYYPLSDRHVPAAHKIATPLMAVQAQDTLMALLWDENQEWAPGEKYPAARFNAPAFDSGYKNIHMSLFAPSVGKYVIENRYDAGPDNSKPDPKKSMKPFAMTKDSTVTLRSVLVLDHKARYTGDNPVNGPHKGALVLQAMQHWFDTYGLPEPSQQPRDWAAERALCRAAYLKSVWSDNPVGWAHCAGWKACGTVGPIVSLMLDTEAGISEPDHAEVQNRIDTVFDDTLKTKGKHYFWSNAGCHILLGELPFYKGYVAESLADFRKTGTDMLAGREKGLWVWKPQNEKMATLGTAGDSTLAQAAHPSYVALRAARLTGDRTLAVQALEAMKQMELYEVPRGAQTWECPLRQPDILAAAQAIRAYCEAYRLTGDKHYIEQARYWGWTGLPFLYMWEKEGYPTMRYNAISVFGSTFYAHSWLGLPVVWCGLVYAYALQDLAQFDDSFPWNRIAQGITNSAMWQQYTEGTSKGTYPDSWNMIQNKPNPANINPENIYVNEFRLRGQSPEIRCVRLEQDGKRVMFNTAAEIIATNLDTKKGAFTLRNSSKHDAYALLAPVPEPTSVTEVGDRLADSDALYTAKSGWMYDKSLQAVIVKIAPRSDNVPFEVSW